MRSPRPTPGRRPLAVPPPMTPPRAGRSGGRVWVILAAMCCSVLLAAGCGEARVHGTPSTRGPSGTPSTPSTPSTRGPSGPSGTRASPASPASPGCRVAVPGFSCLMQERIAAARRYLAKAPGRIGLVLRDRLTGAAWRNADARRAFPAASTVKLAMVVDLLLREDAGEIRLSPADRSLIDAALRESSDSAADRLWYAYEDASFLSRIRAFGMTGVSSASPPHWGAMTCSATDLSNLMDYVLDRLPASDRAEITTDMRHVAPIQRWGVWGAGPRNRPGNKNGWVHAGGVWAVSTVGFAGPDARYTLAIMDDLGGQAGFDAGADTLTQVAAILFQGHRIPAPDVSATP